MTSVKNIPIRLLVDEEILDPFALSSFLVTQTDYQLRKLEVQRQSQQSAGRLKLEQEERTRQSVGTGRKNAERKHSSGERNNSNG